MLPLQGIRVALPGADASGKLGGMPGEHGTAFVFAGGSSLGAVQVGMLKALIGRGIFPDLVVGSSVGAINAAYFASNPTETGVAEMDRLWRRLKRRDVFPVSPFSGLWSLLRRDHVVSAGGLSAMLESNISVREFEQTRLPCCIVATDMLTGREIRIRSGPLIPALLASAAIPGVFPPVSLRGRFLIDGGVASHTPLTAALDLGARTVYVLPTGYSCSLASPPRTAVASALHGLNLLIVRQLQDAVQRFGAQADIRVAPPLCPLPVSPYDFDRAGELIERAEESTFRWLEAGVKMIDGVPHQLPPHSHDDALNPYGPYWH